MRCAISDTLENRETADDDWYLFKAERSPVHTTARTSSGVAAISVSMRTFAISEDSKFKGFLRAPRLGAPRTYQA